MFMLTMLESRLVGAYFTKINT